MNSNSHGSVMNSTSPLVRHVRLSEGMVIEVKQVPAERLGQDFARQRFAGFSVGNELAIDAKRAVVEARDARQRRASPR